MSFPDTAGPLSRRRFLKTVLGGFALVAGGRYNLLGIHSDGAAENVPAAESLSGSGVFKPEYASSLNEVLLVYDQVEPGYFFGEAIEVINNLPPRTKVYFLASKNKAERARQVLEKLDMRRCEVVTAPAEKLWASWGRDIFQLGWRNGKRSAIVPYSKLARSRGQLTIGYEMLKRLKRPNLNLYLAPVSYEGGNLFYDVIDDEKVLFVGNSAVLETASIYQYWFGRKLSTGDVLDLFRKSFEVDRVIPLGRRKGDLLLPQASFCFHIDMAMTLVSRGEAVVAGFDPSQADKGEIEAAFRKELEECLSDPEKRKEIEKLLSAKGCRVTLPGRKEEMDAHIRASLNKELGDITESAEEMDAHASALKGLGYSVKRIETDWRHVRKYQSYTNIIASIDRLIMPIFPAREYTRSRVIPLPTGRKMIGILGGGKPNEYEMTGLNLGAYEFYKKIAPGVRVVEDYFYLACGNVHCILGRLS